MKKRVAIILLMIAFFGIMIYFINPYKFIEIFNNSNKYLLVLAFVFQLNALLLRTLRWKYIVGNIKFKDILPVEVSGLAAAAFSPVRSGDVVKAYLLKKQTKMPISKGLPTILWEEVTNAISFSSVALLSIAFLSRKMKLMFIVSIAIFGVGIFYIIKLLYSKNGVDKIANFIEYILNKIKFIKIKLISEDKIKMFKKTGRLKRKKLIYSFIYAILIAINDGTIFYIILKSLGVGVSYFHVIPLFCASVIIGSLIVFLPAGVGSVDGVLIALFSFAPIKTIMTAVLLFRIATLWFTGFLGIISYLFIKR